MIRWFRRLRGGAEPARIIVIGHDIPDAQRACRWLNVSPSNARSSTSVGRLRGLGRNVTVYVTERCSSLELEEMLLMHAGTGGTVIWINELMYGRD